MPAAVVITVEMLENRQRALDKTVAALRRIAENKCCDPFQFAVAESIRAHRQRKEMVALQLAAAAYEIAEAHE